MPERPFYCYAWSLYGTFDKVTPKCIALIVQKVKAMRLRFPFWLDDSKEEEAALMDTISTLKRQRAFSAVVRDGIRLMVDLKSGNTDVLVELFPWIAERLTTGQGTTPDPQADVKALEEKIDLLLAQQKANGGYVMQSALPTKPAAALPVAVVTAAAPASADSIADNFLSMFQ